MRYCFDKQHSCILCVYFIIFIQTVYSEQRGVIGLIIYTDPDDHTYKGQEYPQGWMLNQYGVQRGTVNRLPGDALSIGYPSKGMLNYCFITYFMPPASF